MTDNRSHCENDYPLFFVEPHPCGGASLVIVSPDKAIEHQKTVAMIEYPTDREALLDFIACQWASEASPGLIANHARGIAEHEMS